MRQSTKSVFVCTHLCTVCALCSALDLFVSVHGEYDQPGVLGRGVCLYVSGSCVFLGEGRVVLLCLFWEVCVFVLGGCLHVSPLGWSSLRKRERRGFCVCVENNAIYIQTVAGGPPSSDEQSGCGDKKVTQEETG